MKINM